MGHDTDYEHEHQGSSEPIPEAPTRRPRIGEQIMSKLDEVLDAVRSGGSNAGDEDGEGEEGLPQVTFEPEEEQLPTTAESPEAEPAEGDEGIAAQGEGTANTIEAHRPRFSHPSRRPMAAVDR